jgi:hypothetical protein
MRISEEDYVFMLLMGAIFWEMDPTILMTSNQEDFNKIFLILIVLVGNLYIVTRNTKSYQVSTIAGNVRYLENDWRILD